MTAIDDKIIHCDFDDGGSEVRAVCGLEGFLFDADIWFN